MTSRTQPSPWFAVALLLAVVGAIFACRPSFSPDGNQVVFHFRDPDSPRSGLAIHDRPSGETRLLQQRGQVRALTAAWTPDGRHVVTLASDDDEHLRVALMRLDGEVVRAESFPSDGGGMAVHLAPPVFVDGALWLGGKEPCAIDLSTMERRRFASDDELWFARDGDRVLYATVKGSELELGEVSTGTLERSVLTTVEQPGVTPLLAIDPTGSGRVAVPLTEPVDGVPVIAIVDAEGLALRSVPLGADCELSNLCWAPDGKALFGAFVRGDAAFDIGVFRVPVDAGPPRSEVLTRAVPRASDEGDSGEEQEDLGIAPWLFQLAMSPDGTTLALNTAAAPGSAGVQDIGLFLVDVSSDPWQTRRIEPPRMR